MKKFILLFFFLLFSCSNEYTSFHAEKEKSIYENVEIQSELDSFSFVDIWYLSWTYIKETPDLDFLEDLVSKIDNSKEKVYVEVYIFTEKRLRKALIDAYKRWVEVKVLLEKNVYKAPYLNNDVYKALNKSWINVKYSNADNYSLNHTKMMIIDDEVVLSTGNYSYSTFKYNREFFIFIKDNDFLNKALEIYNSDFEWIKKNIYHSNLILSPFYSRFKMEYLLKNAKSSIKIYAHNFWDEWIIDILKEKKKENIDIKMILPDLKKVSSNDNEIELFKNLWIDLKIIDKPEIHAKAILVDEKYLYLWSVNFSFASFDKNREVWILLSNPEIIKYFLKVFNLDFSN